MSNYECFRITLVDDSTRYMVYKCLQKGKKNYLTPTDGSISMALRIIFSQANFFAFPKKIRLICSDSLIVVYCFALLYIVILDISFSVFISLKIVSHPIKMKLASGMILTHG